MLLCIQVITLGGAKARIMSNVYRKTDGKANDWSGRAQHAADKNAENFNIIYEEAI